MELALSRKSYERGLNLYLLFIGVMTLAYGLLTARISRSWAIADWLINYEGGFVRRGLPGEVAYRLGHLLHLSPVDFAVLFYLSLYLVLLLAVRKLALAAAPSYWVLALLLSPATLAFQVLDATAGFRKEMIYLAALALLLTLLQRAEISAVAVSAYMAFAIGIAVLSHESLICYTPYFFAALLLSGRTVVQAAKQFALPLVLGLAAAFVCSHHLGSLNTATQICSSLGYQLLPQGNQICSGGAIAYLLNTREMARQDTLNMVHGDHYFIIYGYGIVLSLLPLIAGGLALARAGFRREVRMMWALAALSFSGSLVLFVYAEDWGRWIYIHIVSLALLMLYLDGRRRATASVPEEQVRLRIPQQQRVLAGVLLVAYATLWTLPHVPMLTPRFGYVGLANYALHYRHSHS